MVIKLLYAILYITDHDIYRRVQFTLMGAVPSVWVFLVGYLGTKLGGEAGGVVCIFPPHSWGRKSLGST